MRKILILLIGIFLILGVTALSFSNIDKKDFKNKVKKLDSTNLCLKEDSLKIKYKKCKIDTIKIKDIDTDLIKENKKLGMVMISND